MVLKKNELYLFDNSLEVQICICSKLWRVRFFKNITSSMLSQVLILLKFSKLLSHDAFMPDFLMLYEWYKYGIHTHFKTFQSTFC